MNKHKDTNPLEDLYKLADNIYALKHQESIKNFLFAKDNPQYENICFKTYFCGEPKVYAGLNIPLVISQSFPSPFGAENCYGCNYIINCRKLSGVFDLEGRQIYQGSNGTLFVYKYLPPVLSTLEQDSAYILPPRIELPESKDMHYIYNKAAELLVNQIYKEHPIEDELIKLSLINRITELQTQAYLQGKGNSNTETIIKEN